MAKKKAVQQSLFGDGPTAGLGASDAEHDAEAERYRKKAAKAFRAAQTSANKGNCKSALTSLLTGSSAMGAAKESDMTGSNPYRGLKTNIPTLQRGARSAFNKHCKFAPKK